MPSLRDLKKRLQSVKTTGQLAGAMRTAATAKYARASGKLTAFAPYAGAARELAALAEAAADGGRAKPQRKRPRGDEPSAEATPSKPAIVLLSGNRGLCGGYNHELFNYFSEVLKRCPEPRMIITCGRMAKEFCEGRGMELYRSFTLSDVPTFDEARTIACALRELYGAGEVSSVDIVYQRFVNMLKQQPDMRRFLPLTEGDGEEAEAPEGDTLFIPDAETVRKLLADRFLAIDLYSLLLSCASGAQAATLMAMRSAYDNANASAKQLEMSINRLRQAKVTESVIETSSGPDSKNY